MAFLPRADAAIDDAGREVALEVGGDGRAPQREVAVRPYEVRAAGGQLVALVQRDADVVQVGGDGGDPVVSRGPHQHPVHHHPRSMRLQPPDRRPQRVEPGVGGRHPTEQQEVVPSVPSELAEEPGRSPLAIEEPGGVPHEWAAA